MSPDKVVLDRGGAVSYVVRERDARQERQRRIFEPLFQILNQESTNERCSSWRD